MDAVGVFEPIKIWQKVHCTRPGWIIDLFRGLVLSEKWQNTWKLVLKRCISYFSEGGCIIGPQWKYFALVQLLAPPLHIIILWIKGQDMEKPNQIQKGMTSKTRFIRKSVLFLLCFYHFNLLIFSTLRLHLNSMLAEGRWWQRLPKQLALQCKGSAK